MTVYACTQTDCPERFRGFTDEPDLHCSVCITPLTPMQSDGRSLDEINAEAEQRRPRAEVSE